MVSRALYCTYRWFRGRTGCVGRDAQAALQLARAELLARERGWVCSWEDDPDGMPEGGLCSCGCGTVIEACEGCILRDASGKVLASLWGVWDADDDYRRYVEAQLALEAAC